MSLASLEDISRFNYEFNQCPDCQCTTRIALELNQEPFLIRIEGLESDEAAAIVTSTLDPITILLDLRKIKLVPMPSNYRSKIFRAYLKLYFYTPNRILEPMI